MKGDRGEVYLHSQQRLDTRSWYRITCTRARNQVTIEVLRLNTLVVEDSVSKTGNIGEVRFPPGTPLSVGGKLLASGVLDPTPDQLNGLVRQASYRLY